MTGEIRLRNRGGIAAAAAVKSQEHPRAATSSGKGYFSPSDKAEVEDGVFLRILFSV